MSKIAEVLMSMMEAGFQVAIRQVKGGEIVVEAHDFDPIEPHSFYGRGPNISVAIEDAYGNFLGVFDV